MIRHYRRGAVALIVMSGILLAGCASEPASVEDRTLESARPIRAENHPQAVVHEAPGGTYRVVRGDTLYSIAFKRGLDFRDVAAWNGISPPFKILVDQTLRLSPPGGANGVAATAVASSPKLSSAPSQNPPQKPIESSPPANPPAQSGSMFEDVRSEPIQPDPAPVQTAPAPVASPSPIAASAAVSAHIAPPAAAPPASSVPVPVPVEAPSKPVAVSVPPAKPVDEGASNNIGGIAWHWPSSGKVIGNFVNGDQTKQGVDIAGSSGDPVQAAADGEVVYSGNGLLGYGELIIVKHNASFLSAYGHNRKRLVSEGDRVKAGQQIAEMGSSASSRDELHFEIRKNGKPVNPLDFLPSR